MTDWGVQVQDFNQVVINPSSAGSVGAELLAWGFLIEAQDTAWISANRAIFVPFVIYQPFTVVKIFVDNAIAISGNIDVGIYDTEGNLVVSKGSTAQSGGNALQTFDITDTLLNPGVYYLATVLDNTTGGIWRWKPATAHIAGSMGLLSMATAFPLPAIATFAACADAYIPGTALTARTLV